MYILYIILALIVLLLMITVHECGHYVAGKIFKFKITEFSIGFGKSIYSRTNKKTGEKFSIRLIPLGGYCAFDGEDAAGSGGTKAVSNEKPIAAEAELKASDSAVKNNSANATSGSFYAQAPWKRLIVQFAGAFFNFVFAILMAALMLLIIGFDIPQIKSVDSAYNSNLKKGDVILAVDGEKVSILGGNMFNTLMSKYEAGEEVTLTVKNNGKQRKEVVMLYNDAETDNAIIGIKVAAYKHKFFESIGRSFEVAIGMAGEVLVAFWQLISGQLALNNVTGPVGTIGAIASVSAVNIAALLILIPLISINLAVFNLLPLPALDGGRMVFTTIEMIFKKPVRRDIEAYIHFVGLLLLFGLVIMLDLFNLF